jgi:hypothetical protein
MNEPERPRNARQPWPAGNNSRSRTKICQFGKHFRSFGGTVDRSRWICAPGLFAPRLKPHGRLSIGCTICCEACGTAVPAYDVVSYGSIEKGYRELCSGPRCGLGGSLGRRVSAVFCLACTDAVASRGGKVAYFARTAFAIFTALGVS